MLVVVTRPYFERNLSVKPISDYILLGSLLQLRVIELFLGTLACAGCGFELLGVSQQVLVFLSACFNLMVIGSYVITC